MSHHNPGQGELVTNQQKADVATQAVAATDPVELFIGLVGGMGTDLERVIKILSKGINNEYHCDVQPIKISDLFRRFDAHSDVSRAKLHGAAYYRRAIQAGNAIRDAMGAQDALAKIAAADISDRRGALAKSRRVFIIDSLKRPEEIDMLRQIYGPLFYCISIYADQRTREDRLTEKFTTAAPAAEDAGKARQDATNLVRDDQDDRKKWGQRVRKAFQNGDYFVRTDEGEELDRSLHRFLQLVFNEPYVSPTRSEVAMSHARTAGLRSVDLSRQVGAAVVARDGRLLSTGCNEVPSAGGGQYWEDDPDDARDFRRGHDENDRMKERAVVELIDAMSDLFKEQYENTGETVYKILVDQHRLDDTRIDGLIEFGRVVHAENAAIDSAGLGGISVQDADLYCTTFPCHMCTRVIIDTGIRNVFYIEPYPKSAAFDLYSDSIVVNPKLPRSAYEERLRARLACDRRVHYIPFEGVAPRRYTAMFISGRRKKDNGDVETFEPGIAMPRQWPQIPTHQAAEQRVRDDTIKDIDRINASVRAVE
jgi:deoxycytidylate deaminase